MIRTRETSAKVTTETAYYLLSTPLSAERFGHVARSHWAVENSLHWCLDVIMNEDNARNRLDNGPYNLAILRHMALNLIRKEPSKGSLRVKIKRAGWKDAYPRQSPRSNLKLFLGHPLKAAGGLLVARSAQEQAAAKALAPLDPTIDPAAPIRTLKVAQRQIVEIARAMMEDAKVLAMDEPTSSLTPAEFERLAVLIAELAAHGVSIIYVSHKMDEVFRVCETATILRDGRKVTDVVMKDTTESAVVARMVGRELAQRRA